MKFPIYFIGCLYFFVTCAFADGVGDITYLNRWPTVAPNVIATLGDYAFHGDGDVIAVYKTLSDDDLTLVARADIRLTPGEELATRHVSGTEGISGLCQAGGYLYAACGNEGLQIFEIPVDAGDLASGDWKSTFIIEKEDGRAVVRDVAVVGNLAYVGYYWLSSEGYDSGIQVVDVTDPANPVLAGEAELPSTFAELKRVQALSVANGYAYVADMYNGLTVFDLSDPTTPVVDGVCYIASALDVAVSGNYAYLVCAGYGLQVVNVNPDQFSEEQDILSLVAFCQYNDSLTKAVSVETDDGYAYVGDVDQGVLVIDISAPVEIDNSSVIVQYDEAKGAYGLFLDAENHHLFIGDRRNGLQKVDVTAPAAPAALARVKETTTPADADDVFVDSETSYLFTVDDDPVSGDLKEGVRIFFAVVSEDYVSFLLKGRFPTDGEANDVYYFDGYLYVADGSGGLKIINPDLPDDTTGLINPTLTAGLAIGDGNANGVFVSMEEDFGRIYAYLAAGTGGLKIFDVSDPAAPALVGELAGTDVSDARQVIVKADFAFVADGWNGLKVVDVTQRDNPVLTGTYLVPDGDDLDDIPGCVQDVNVVGTLAYLAAGNEGLYVVSVADTSNPTWSANYSALPYFQVKGLYAARSDESEGVDLIWLANGTAPDDNMGFFVAPSTVPPQRSGAYHTSGDVKDVFVVGNYAYLSDSSGGFQALAVYEDTSGDDGDNDWDDSVVPVDTSRSKNSGCFIDAVFSGMAKGLKRLF